MKYTKKLLARETKDIQEAQFYGQLFEILNNEKTLEEFAIKAISNLKSIVGKIYVVKRNGESLDVLTEEENESKDGLLKSTVYKKIKETKKPFFFNECDENEGEVYAGFPLNLKGRFIGAVIIEEKQDIKQWKELFVILHMLVFAYRFYSLVEKERTINIKDVVTGLYNEKYFHNHFEVEQEKYIRFKTPMTLVLFEVVNLADIIEKHGYDAGEKVLQHVGKIIENQSRLIDMPARIERGVFAVLLSNAKEIGGQALTNRVNMIISNNKEIDGVEYDIQFKFAYSQFENHHSRESFFTEVYKKLEVNE